MGKLGGTAGSEEVARWKRCKGNEVAIRLERSRGVVKWQGGRFLVLFKSGEHRVSPKFHLFVSDIDKQ